MLSYFSNACGKTWEERRPSTYTLMLHEANTDACETDIVDSSDSLDLSDSSDLGTVPAIFAPSFVTCSANCRYLKPYWRRLAAVTSVPLWLPLLLRCHPCICATTRSIEQWPGHRFSSHVGQRPPTVVRNNPARAHTK